MVVKTGEAGSSRSYPNVPGVTLHTWIKFHSYVWNKAKQKHFPNDNGEIMGLPPSLMSEEMFEELKEYGTISDKTNDFTWESDATRIYFILKWS